MNLLWREFERKVRGLHRAELDRSPELRAEFKRQRKIDRRIGPQLTRRLLLPLFWCAIFLSLVGKQTQLDLPAAAIAVWAAGAAFRWGHHWFQQFYASEDLVVLNMLPLDDSQIFEFQLRRYLSAAGWIFWEMTLAYAVLALLEGSTGPPLGQLLIAGMIQGWLVVALALHGASWLHMLPLGTIGGLLRLTAIALLILGTQGSEITSYLLQASQWFLPTGWINYVLLEGHRDRWIYVLLLPIFAIIYLARYSFDRLRMYYSLAGFEIIPSRSAVPVDDEELTAASFGRRSGPTEIEDTILARSFLAGVNWELAGIIEKLAARFLNARERVVTEFLVGGNPGWTQGLKLSFWIWLVSCIVVVALGQFGGTIIFFSAYVLATTSLPLFGGDWRGMRQSATGGVWLPAYSLYPISFNAIARIFLKVNLFRIAAASPFIVSFAALAAFRLEQNIVSGAIVGAKLLGIFICLQPLFILFPISNTTNDTSRSRMVGRILLFAPVLVALLGAAIAVFLSRTGLGILSCYCALLLLASFTFAAYRRAYRRGYFDLLSDRAQHRG